jgi:NTE family protein
MMDLQRGLPRIALALGGGAARGLAHVAMLEVFDELAIKPAIIAGTSMGAICGAAYAAGLSAAEIRAHCEELFGNRARFFRRLAGALRGGLSTLWSPRNPNVVDNVTLFKILLPAALRCDFAALKLPFLAVAADYYAIEQVILDSGPLIPALAASSALPMLSRPVLHHGRLLIDGGYVNPVPYDVVMHKADLTVAIDVTGDTRRLAARSPQRIPGTLELLTGATQMLFHSITREKLKSKAPDLFIRPHVGSFAALDYFRFREILSAAAPAKQELKGRIRQWLAAAGLRSLT